MFKSKIKQLLSRFRFGLTGSEADLLQVIDTFQPYFSGDIKFQERYEHAYWLMVNEMNIGKGSSVESSGELFVINRLKNAFDKNAFNKNRLGHYIVFDVGANIGDYSNKFAEILGDKADIFAFEPSLETYQKLKQNVYQQSNIIPVNIGLGDVDGKHTLFLDKAESVLASLYKRQLDHLDIHMSKTEEISIMTLDGFCADNNIDHINFLKLDVEGHELKVFAGANGMLSTDKIDAIQFEFGGCNIDSRTYFQDFFYRLNDKYHIYRILKNGLYPIRNYNERYEIFSTTNFYAEHR